MTLAFDVLSWVVIVGLALALIVMAVRRPSDEIEPMTRRDVERFLRWVDQDRREHPERES